MTINSSNIAYTGFLIQKKKYSYFMIYTCLSVGLLLKKLSLTYSLVPDTVKDLLKEKLSCDKFKFIKSFNRRISK